MSQADAATALGTTSLSVYTLPLPYSLGRAQAVHEVTEEAVPGNLGVPLEGTRRVGGLLGPDNVI